MEFIETLQKRRFWWVKVDAQALNEPFGVEASGFRCVGSRRNYTLSLKP